MNINDNETFAEIMNFLWQQSGRSGVMPVYDLGVFADELEKYPLETIKVAATIYAKKGVNYGLKLAEFVEIIEGSPSEEAQRQLNLILAARKNQKYSPHGFETGQQIEVSYPAYEHTTRKGKVIQVPEKVYVEPEIEFLKPEFKDKKTQAFVELRTWIYIWYLPEDRVTWFGKEFLEFYKAEKQPAKLIGFDKQGNDKQICFEGSEIDISGVFSKI